MAPFQAELDLASIKKSLKQLDEDAEKSRLRVLDGVRVRAAEFSAASGKVNELQKLADDLYADLGDLGTWLPAEPVPSTAPTVSLRPKEVQEVAAKHAQLTANLNEVNDAVEILATILDVETRLKDMDMISKRSFLEAAERLQEVAKALERVSAPYGQVEPEMVQSAKSFYCLQRARLVSSVDARMSDLVSSGRIRSRGCESVWKEIWQVFEVLGLRAKRLDGIVADVQKLLTPLLAGSQLGPERRLVCKGSDTKQAGVEVWEWEPAAAYETCRLVTSKPPVSAVLEPLQRLFAHAWHWTGEVKEVYASLGSKLYTRTARQLLSHFEVYAYDDGQAAECFESQLQAQGFLHPSDGILSRHVRQQRSASKAASRTAILVEAKVWLQADAELVSVSDDTHGSIQQVLSACEVHPKMKESLQQDACLLRLPSMKVSNVMVQLVRRIVSLAEAASGQEEETKDVHELVRRLCVLFAIVRPHVHQLKTDPANCSIFFTDLLYLVHTLTVLPYQWPTMHQSMTLPLALDLVPHLRQLGEQHFCGMLRYQKEQLLVSLRRCNLGRGAAENNAYVEAEAALGTAAQQLKNFCHGAAVLPGQILQESVLLLLGVFCKVLVRKLLETAHHPTKAKPGTGSKPATVDLTSGVGRVVGLGGRLLETAFAGVGSASGSEDLQEVLAGLKGGPKDSTVTEATEVIQSEVWVLDAEDVSSVVSLLASAQAMVRQSLQAANISNQCDEVPAYSALCIVTDLLGSDFSRFLEHRSKIQGILDKDDVILLMKLSWQDEALSAEEAWRVLAG